ncbi:MAG: hypothetical protein MTP17_03665 [Candidatus Midichloria sp.]|nr:MAG: hypothetical protein MTP17_03665 [Candidatus Midichloria sp.]
MPSQSIALGRFANLLAKTPGVISAAMSKTLEKQQAAFDLTLNGTSKAALQNITALGLNFLKNGSQARTIFNMANTGFSATGANLLKTSDTPASSMKSIVQDMVKAGALTFGTQVTTSISDTVTPNLLKAAESIVANPIFEVVDNLIPDLPEAITANISDVATSELSNAISISNSSSVIEQSAETVMSTALDTASIVSSDLEDILLPDPVLSSTILTPQKFPTMPGIKDYSQIMPGEVPEFIKNLISWLYSGCSSLCNLLINTCSTISTALYNGFTYLHDVVVNTYNIAIASISLIKDIASYTYAGLIHIKDFTQFCLVEHPFIVAGIAAFVVTAYIVKKYHLLDYAKTVAEIGYCGVEAAVQTSYHTTKAALLGACYIVDSGCNVYQKTWQYLSPSDDYRDDQLYSCIETSDDFCEC